MKNRIHMKLLVAASFLLPLVTLYSDPPIILPADDPEASESHRIIWSTDPGIRYELQESTDLSIWTTVEGFPSEAQALVQQHKFETDEPAKFFRVIEMDEQAPKIVSKSPRDGSFGVERFTAVTVELADRSGIEPESISLSIGGEPAITLAHPALSLEDGVLVYDLEGDLALGYYGHTVEFSLSVADLLGNSADYAWSFELEREPVYVGELFIFGSPDAQRLGQEIGPIPTRAVAQRWAGQSGPIRMNAEADPWRLTLVAEDRLVIEYEDVSPAPHFAADQYLCNITPATLDEIFYRRVTAVSDDPATSTLTLITVDVGLHEIALQETFRLDENAMAFEVDEFGVITRAVEVRSYEGRFALDPIEIDWGGKSVFGTYTDSGGSLDYRFGLPIEDSPPVGGSWNSRLLLDQAYLNVTPVLDLVLETGGVLGLRLDRFTADFDLEVDSALVPRYEFEVESEAISRRDTLWEAHKVILIKIGWIHINPKLDLSTGLSAGLTGSISAGVTGGFSPYAVIDYNRERQENERVQYDHGIRNRDFSVIEPFLLVDGSLSAHAKLIPEIDMRFISLVGCYINIDPGVTVTGLATVENTTLTSAELTVLFDAHLNAGMSLLGAGEADWLPAMNPVSLLNPPWEYRWSYPEEDVLRFVQHPGDATVLQGRALELSALASGPGSITYEWFKDGSLYQYGGDRLVISSVNTGHSGEYYVRATSGGQSVNSETAMVTVTQAGGGPAVESIFDFDDGTMQGWTEIRTDSQRRQYFAIVPPNVSSPKDTPHSGGHFLGLLIPSFGGEPFYTQDSPHDTLLLRSPEFTLNGSGDLTAWLAGGGAGSPSLAGTSVGALASESSSGGFLGIALRNANTGNYVLSASKTSSGNEWEQVSFTAAQLAALPQGNVYTLDLIDARQGGWGWVNMDSVTIPGTIKMKPAPGPAPEGFALIPAGTYARGDHKNESESWMELSRPVHEVYVSAFYMAETPVTYAQWREVYDWAVQNGYGFDNSGTRGWLSGDGELPDTPSNNQHPVVLINWYDMVKWGNARSEMEGLTPVYYTNDARTVVYKTGRHDVTNAQVRWGADGYRLPTEAEWEKAARGGLHGKRWPWGDEAIDGTRANYSNSSGTNGTTVVGSYPANGYGLYDMAGNVWEWVWDWYDGDWYGKAGATEPDTRGPSSGSNRVSRGGSWSGGPVSCRVAYRDGSRPGDSYDHWGFRLARTD